MAEGRTSARLAIGVASVAAPQRVEMKMLKVLAGKHRVRNAQRNMTEKEMARKHRLALGAPHRYLCFRLR